MNENMFLLMAFIAGLMLGSLFFTGLYLTVKVAVTSKTPDLWILGSFLFRTSIMLVGFYFVSFGSWQRLLICLIGFIVARTLYSRLINHMKKNLKPLQNVASHETKSR